MHVEDTGKVPKGLDFVLIRLIHTIISFAAANLVHI